jgi:hypothetical protein
MLQQTVEEQERDLRWHRRRRRAMTPRRLLQESDELLFWVEECLVQEIRIVPGWLVSRLMVVLRHAHADLPSRLGRERRPEQVMEIIYDAQAALMDQADAQGSRDRLARPICCGSTFTFTRATRTTVGARSPS